MLHPDVEALADRYHDSLDKFLAGDPDPIAELWAQTDEVSLANPLGPPVRGWQTVLDTMRRAAANFRDGRATGFERISDFTGTELAYMVEIERYESKVGGATELAPIAVRVTTVFRRDDGEWCIVHRHADPITSHRPAEQVLQR